MAMISFGQISKIGVSTFLCSCGIRAFQREICKEISTIILNSTLFTTSWLDVLILLLIMGGVGVGFENWADWAWARAGRRAGIH